MSCILHLFYQRSVTVELVTLISYDFDNSVHLFVVLVKFRKKNTRSCSIYYLKSVSILNILNYFKPF